MEARLLLAFVRASLKRVGVQRLADGLALLERRSLESGSPAELAGAVVAAGRGRPDQCLAEALTLWSMLRRRGFAAELVFGASGGADTLEAHAWVEWEGQVLIGGVERPRFQELWRR